MGRKTVVWCLSLFMFYFMIAGLADGYVVKIIFPEENNSVEEENNEIEVDTLVKPDGSEEAINKRYNRYNLTTPGKADSYIVCDNSDTGYTYFPNIRSCYKVHTERASWPVAELTCIREGGKLAVINSDEEARALRILYPGWFRVVHIGVVLVQGSWKTIDGKTLSEAGYEHWNEGEPNNVTGDQNCGAMYFDGRLDDISCSDETAFVCEKAPSYQPHPPRTSDIQMSLFLTDAVTTTEKSSDMEPNQVEIRNKCGTNDTGYQFFPTYPQSCYKFHKESASWDEAEATCVREGGHLAVINSPREGDIFTTRFDYGWSLFYLGFHLVEDSWVTIHDQTLSETKIGSWREGQPRSDFGKQLCGAMFYDESFASVPCHYSMPFICEKDPKSQPQGRATGSQTNFDTTETGTTKEESSEKKTATSIGIHNECGTTDTDYRFIEGTQSCYKVHTDRATWDDAEATCVREGGHLALINSPARNDLVFYVRSFPRHSNQVFLGFHLKEGSWVTIQGQDLAETGYENWGKDQPNNYDGDQNCGAMFPEGTLNDVDCNTKHEFICQKDSIFKTSDTEPKVQNNSYLDTTSVPQDTSTTDKTESQERVDDECDATYEAINNGVLTRSCIKLHKETASRDEADAICKRNNGTLVTVDTSRKAKLLRLLLPDFGSYNVYIGQTTGYLPEMPSYGSPENPPCVVMHNNGFRTTLYCNKEYFFFCEMIIPLAINASNDGTGKDSTSVPQDTSTTDKTESQERVDDECDTTYEAINNGVLTRSCIKLHKETASRDEADAICKRNNGTLVKVDNFRKARVLRLLLPDTGTYNVYIGQTTGYLPELPSFGAYEHPPCNVLYDNGFRSTSSCNNEYFFFCEMIIPLAINASNDGTGKDDDTFEEEYSNGEQNDSSSECSTTATGYTFYKSTRSCYKVHTDRATWDDADATCVREGGHLAVINSRDEADIIMQMHNMLPKVTHIFIGFSYRRQDSPTTSNMFEFRENGTWLTINGQTLSEAGYENWTPGEPNNAGGREYCGTIYGNGKFDDAACYSEFVYICEIKSS